MKLDFSPGTLCVANGRVLQIDGPDTIATMSVRDVATGTLAAVPIHQLQPLPEAARKVQAASVTSAKEWERAVKLVQELQPFNNKRAIDRRSLRRIAKKFGVSCRQVQRDRVAFARKPVVMTLVRTPRGRARGVSLLDRETESLINEMITTHYLKREGCSKSHLVRRVRSRCRKEKRKEPSPKAILTRIARMGPADCDRARQGAKRAGQSWGARPGRLAIDRPLGMIQIDHTRVDLIVVSNDAGRRPIGRPWLTVAIDVATRCVVGIYLSMKAPSAVSVALCIEHAVLPKQENEGNPGIWPMYGRPEVILVDNGKDFRSEALRRGCANHQIDLRFRPVATPHYGAHVERLIGTLMQMVHLLPGTTFSNPKQRGNYDSEAHANMTLEELRNWLVEKICREYHVQKHAGLGMAPLLAWERGHTNAAGEFLAPPIVAKPEEFRIDFLPFELRRVKRTGINLCRRRYWHDQLTGLIESPDDAIVSYDPRDLSRVWVRRPDGRLIEVPCVYVEPTVSQASVSDEDHERLELAAADGYEAADRIQAEAAHKTRMARRAKGHTKRRQNPPHLARTKAHRDATGARPAGLASIDPKRERRSFSVTEWD